MDAKYKFIHVQTALNGWVWLNVEHISEIHKMPNGSSIFVRMASGEPYLINGRYAKKVLEETVE